MPNNTQQPRKQSHNKKFYSFPALGLSVQGYSHEDALKQAQKKYPQVFCGTDETKPDLSNDLNGDGKVDDKDFSKAGKTLSQAKIK